MEEYGKRFFLLYLRPIINGTTCAKYFWQIKKITRTGIVMVRDTTIIWPILVVPMKEFKNC